MERATKLFEGQWNHLKIKWWVPSKLLLERNLPWKKQTYKKGVHLGTVCLTSMSEAQCYPKGAGIRGFCCMCGLKGKVYKCFRIWVKRVFCLSSLCGGASLDCPVLSMVCGCWLCPSCFSSLVEVKLHNKCTFLWNRKRKEKKETVQSSSLIFHTHQHSMQINNNWNQK